MLGSIKSTKSLSPLVTVSNHYCAMLPHSTRILKLLQHTLVQQHATTLSDDLMSVHFTVFRRARNGECCNFWARALWQLAGGHRWALGGGCVWYHTQPQRPLWKFPIGEKSGISSPG